MNPIIYTFLSVFYPIRCGEKMSELVNLTEEEQRLWEALPGDPGSPMDQDMSLTDILGGRREGDTTDIEESEEGELTDSQPAPLHPPLPDVEVPPLPGVDNVDAPNNEEVQVYPSPSV